MRYNELRKREVDTIKDLLLENYGFVMPKSWMLYYLGKEKVWVLKEEFFNLPLEKFNVETMGFYLCHFEHDIFRLSIQGAQIVGETATKNILDISLKDAWELLRGFDIDKETHIVVDNFEELMGVCNFWTVGIKSGEKLANRSRYNLCIFDLLNISRVGE